VRVSAGVSLLTASQCWQLAGHHALRPYTYGASIVMCVLCGSSVPLYPYPVFCTLILPYYPAYFLRAPWSLYSTPSASRRSSPDIPDTLVRALDALDAPSGRWTGRHAWLMDPRD
jgi:hypothetical protein